jgi:hypothetical protein
VQEVDSNAKTPLVPEDEDDNEQSINTSNNKENEQIEGNAPEKEGIPAMANQGGDEAPDKGQALRDKFNSYFREEGKEEADLTPEEKKKEIRRKLAQNKLGKATPKEPVKEEEVKEPVILSHSKNVFEEVSRIMHAILSENRGKNLKLKRLVIYNLLPTLVNKSKGFMKHQHSARFMVLIDDAM